MYIYLFILVVFENMFSIFLNKTAFPALQAIISCFICILPIFEEIINTDLARAKNEVLLNIYSLGGHAIYHWNARGAWNAKFHSTLHEAEDVRTDDFVRAKISWMHG